MRPGRGEHGSPLHLCLFVLMLLTPTGACFAQPAGAPVIDKIDPPNWWPTLPDPMLLVYGQNLTGSQFSVRGDAVLIRRTHTSLNGHYAFLWLSTTGAKPEEIEIIAHNRAGSAHISFELNSREPARGRYQGFNSADIMYLIMTDRFADADPSNDQPGYAPSESRGWHGGDFRGIGEHLDYLQQLGITTLWLTPILSNGKMPQSYHGYAATDLYAVDSHFGTLADYQRLIADLHRRSMKMVFDIVPNHIGVEHPWVHDPPTPDWFHGTFEHHSHVRSNFEEIVDPHAAPADSLDITQGWFTDSMPDMNQENPLVASYLIQNAIWWIETTGLDGLRIDTFPYVDRPFWSQFHAQLHSIYPNLTTVGEIFNGDPAITSFFAGGVTHAGIDTGLYTPFDFPSYFTLRDVLLHDKPMTALAAVMAADHLYPHSERLVPFFGNHDTRRFLSEPGATTEKLKLAFALLTTMRGTPEIYSGDEIAMEGGLDPDNRRDFPGGFAGNSHNAFNQSERTTKEADIFNWASALIHMRTSHPAFTSGQQDLFADSTAFAYVRGSHLATGCGPGTAEERILIVVSKDSKPRSIDIGMPRTAIANCTQFKPLFPSGAPAPRAETDQLSVSLGADGVAIYSVR